jgi:hypothetical protein
MPGGRCEIRLSAHRERESPAVEGGAFPTTKREIDYMESKAMESKTASKRDERVMQLSKMTKGQLKAEQAKYVRVLMGNGSKDEMIYEILMHEGFSR